MKKKKIANKKYPRPTMLYMTEGMYKELKKVAEAEDRPVSSQMRYVLRQYLMDRAADRLG